MRKGKAFEYVMQTMMPLHGSYQVQSFPAIVNRVDHKVGRLFFLLKFSKGSFFIFYLMKDKVWWLCVWRCCIGKCHPLFYL
jgi:hypothetical protein